MDITRRNLIQGMSTLAAAGALVGVGSALADGAAYVPGTYTAEADGILSAVAVTVTVDEASVLDVAVDCSGETPDIGAAAQDELQAQLLAAGSAEIDGVSGATITSGAAKKAMKGALAKAASGEVENAAQQTGDASGANPSWLGEKPLITDDMCVDTIDCELLVVGSGTAGHFAAMSAVESGRSVLVIEKAAVGLGIRQQMGAIDTKLMRDLGCRVDRNAITEDFTRYSNGWNDPQLVHLWYDNSGPVFDFYNDLCTEAGLKPFLIYHDEHKGSNYGGFVECNQVSADRETGLSPEAVTESYIEANGGTFMYNTKMVELIQDETGKVLGAYATNENDDYIRINSECGVIMATGGYACNREMMRALQPQAAKVIAGERAPITNQGEGIKACLWAGAAKDERGACMLFERAALPLSETDPVKVLEDGTHYLFWMGSQPWLSVDANGERFCNESGPYDYRLHSIAGKGGVMYCIIPGNAYEHNIAYDTDGCSRSASKFCWDGESLYATDDGTDRRVQPMDEMPDYFAKADTIEELAVQLGLPAENLVATVERYNELCDLGEDLDFGREPYRLMDYRQAPFYGVKISGLILCTFDGIVVNTKLQALRPDGSVIENLYCVGNDAGRYFCDTYPNITAGAAGGKSATFGWLAAKNALGTEA